MPLRVDDFPFQGTCFNQRLESLFYKKGISPCPSVEQRGEWPDGSCVYTERRVQELSHFCLRKWTKTNLSCNTESSEGLLGRAQNGIDFAFGIIVRRD